MECVFLTEARYVKDYIVYIKFNTGDEGELNLKDIVFKYDIAKPLRDVDKFAEFYLDEWPTLAWKCGFDISPEFLYERLTAGNFHSA